MSESDWDYVSRVSGVDFLALRDKYKRCASDSKDSSATANNGNATESNIDKLGKSDPNEILSKYSICKSCQGLGVIRTIYNHMTMEKTCEECDGDSILLQQNLDKAVESVHPIDER